MKKTFTLVTGLVLLCSSLAGCGSSHDAAPGELATPTPTPTVSETATQEAETEATDPFAYLRENADWWITNNGETPLTVVGFDVHNLVPYGAEFGQCNDPDGCVGETFDFDGPEYARGKQNAELVGRLLAAKDYVHLDYELHGTKPPEWAIETEGEFSTFTFTYKDDAPVVVEGAIIYKDSSHVRYFELREFMSDDDVRNAKKIMADVVNDHGTLGWAS